MEARWPVEALLEAINGISADSTEFDLWVPDQLTLRGSEVGQDIAMAIILDKLLGKGLMPAGFTQGASGRTYHYHRDNSN